MKPYLSIIVPVYKVERYIRQCIDSILAQTFKDFELILVNDGSPDNCPHICDDYAKKDKRIKVIHKANGGLVSARKAGLREAKGQYIGFVDSDDWIESNMYEILCGVSISKNVDVVICDIIYDYSNKEYRPEQVIEPGFYDKDAMQRHIYPLMLYSGTFYKFGLYPAVWNKIFKKELLENNLYNVKETIRVGEDVACTYPCLLDAKTLYVLEKKYLYHYRLISSSMTRSYDPEYFNRILVLFGLLRNVTNEKCVYDMSQQLDYYISYLVIATIDNEYKKSNTKSNREKNNFIKSITENNDIFKSLMAISLEDITKKSKVYIWLLRKKMNNTLHFVVLLISIIRNINSR